MKIWKNLMSWQRHGIILALILTIAQPLMWWIVLNSPEITLHITILIMTSNITILVYAIYTYRIFNEYQKKTENIIRNIGIDPPTLDMLITKFYEDIKPFLETFKESKISPEDIRKLITLIKSFSEPYENIKPIPENQITEEEIL